MTPALIKRGDGPQEHSPAPQITGQPQLVGPSQTLVTEAAEKEHSCSAHLVSVIQGSCRSPEPGRRGRGQAIPGQDGQGGHRTPRGPIPKCANTWPPTQGTPRATKGDQGTTLVGQDTPRPRPRALRSEERQPYQQLPRVQIGWHGARPGAGTPDDWTDRVSGACSARRALGWLPPRSCSLPS